MPAPAATASIPVLSQAARLILRPFQQPRQLRNIGRDPAGLVAREQIGGRATAGVLLEVDVGERVAFAVLDYEEQEAFASSMSHGGGKRRDVMRSF